MTSACLSGDIEQCAFRTFAASILSVSCLLLIRVRSPVPHSHLQCVGWCSFSGPGPSSRNMSLADVLRPLPLSAVGAFLVSFSDRRGDAALIYQDLQGAGLLGPCVFAHDLEQVVYKLQLARPHWLRARRLPTTAVLKRCPDFRCELECKQVWCHLLTFADGLQPFQLQREICVTCNVAFCGNWKWDVGSNIYLPLLLSVADHH